MNEEEQAMIKAVVHEATTPFMGVVTDLVGICGGDSLKRFRERKRERQEKNEWETLASTSRRLDQRGLKPDPDTSPEKVEEILDAAKDCGTEELRELFARTLGGCFR
jgi:hypothetical protein